MKTNKYKLIVPSSLRPKPDKYELTVAELCTKLFHSNVEFVLRSISSTPDIKVVNGGDLWEIKNIRGRGKHTIEDNLRKAKKQSDKIIISLLKPGSMGTAQALARIKYYLAHNSTGIRRIILITKNQKIIDVYS